MVNVGYDPEEKKCTHCKNMEGGNATGEQCWGSVSCKKGLFTPIDGDYLDHFYQWINIVVANHCEGFEPEVTRAEHYAKMAKMFAQISEYHLKKDKK